MRDGKAPLGRQSRPTRMREYMDRLGIIRVLSFLLATAATAPLFASISVSLGSDGNTVYYSISADDPTYTCVNVSIDNGPWRGGFCSQPGPGRVSDYFTCNW